MESGYDGNCKSVGVMLAIILRIVVIRAYRRTSFEWLMKSMTKEAETRSRFSSSILHNSSRLQCCCC